MGIVKNILKNGNICKEFHGINSDSDFTPLDIDFYKINFEPITFNEIYDTSPIWYVLKCDERLNYSEKTKNMIKTN